MDNNIAARIEQLTVRLYELMGKQAVINDELIALRKEIEFLKRQFAAADSKQQTSPTVKQAELPVAVATPVAQPAPITTVRPQQNSNTSSKRKSSAFEEMLGKNIASRVGIIVTIIGIFIGSRYAIEHNLVKPPVRILTGYLSGLALTGIALRLRKKFEGYSAVLMGGGLSVLYFITYVGYGYYGLIPNLVALVIMLIITGGIIFAALRYNQVLIAHLGQVGAYAIPFLLSDNSGQYGKLFTYIAIINAGIMVLSFRKNWKSLFYVSFGLTWLIFLGWLSFGYTASKHAGIAWLFSVVFFLIFYTTFLAYKLVKKEIFDFRDILILLFNSFIFYGIGMFLLSEGRHFGLSQGPFTVLNALVHLGVALLIGKLKLADRRLYYLAFGLALAFVTIAIPVEFDGNWVTLLWTIEALLLFFIGRTRQAAAYEKLSIVMLLLSFFSLVEDWVHHLERFTDPKDSVRPFLNMTFVTGLITLAGYGGMVYINRMKKYLPAADLRKEFVNLFNYAIPVLFLVTGYMVFQLEIQGYFRQVAGSLHGSDGSFGPWGSEVRSFSFVFLLMYSMVFTALVTGVNLLWIKNRTLALVSLLAILLVVGVLLLHGLPILNQMAANHFDRDGTGLFFGRMNFLMRYLILGIVKILMYLGYRSVKDHVVEEYLKRTWWIMVYVISLSFTSFEYLHWTHVIGADNQYRLGLSVIWGVFALGLIVYGIWKKLGYVRLTAMVLLVITLIKLFAYDLAEAGTVTKTVSFISLGVILLLVSYLYNRYKEVLFGNDQPKT